MNLKVLKDKFTIIPITRGFFTTWMNLNMQGTKVSIFHAIHSKTGI